MTEALRCDVRGRTVCRRVGRVGDAAGASMQDRPPRQSGLFTPGPGFSAPARVPGGQQGALHLSRP